MTDQPAPVASSARLEQLDVLRGLAVLGILLVNAPSFAMPIEVADTPTASPFPFDGQAQAAWWTMRTFFEQKFVTLFSMLFGVSVFLVGGERGADPGRAAVLKRRLLWLALFGSLHGALIWFGDILLLYAVSGLIMARCRSWPARRLLFAGLALSALGSGLLLAGDFAAQSAPGESLLPGVQGWIRLYQSGLAGSQGANLQIWLILTLAIPMLVPVTLGLMMIGLGLFKLGVLQGRASTATYLLLAVLGGVALGCIGWNAQDQIRDDFPGDTRGWDALPNMTLAMVVTLGYVATLSLALRSRLFRPLVLRLAPVGRMAFTNYIAQSLLMTTLFFGGRGLGLYGRLDWPQWSLIVIAIWVLQLIWSPLWLSRFSMGPLEWAWRRLSYGRPLALSRPADRLAVSV